MDAEMARWARRIVGFSYVPKKSRSRPVSQRCGLACGESLEGRASGDCRNHSGQYTRRPNCRHNRSLRRCEKIGGQAKPPAPRRVKCPGCTVGQAVWPAARTAEPIFPHLLGEWSPLEELQEPLRPIRLLRAESAAQGRKRNESAA